jgi:predicted ATP-binding protein involved in virulence
MENFRIESLEINKIGAFEHLKMDFPKKKDPEKAEIHILTGENGTGKSTILEILSRQAYHRNIQEDESNNHKYRLGHKHLVQMTNVNQLSYYRTNLRNILNLNVSASFKLAFFSYAGYRHTKYVQLEGVKEINEHPILDSYIFEGSRNDKNLFQWIANTIARTLMAKGRDEIKKAEFIETNIRLLEQVISEMIEQEFRFELDDNFNVKVFTNDLILYFDALPDGLKAIISWLGDLFMRMDRVLWESHLPITERNFILFLDEIEVHLHPAWQRKILPVVQKLFKNAQIFISTHSPFVVGSVDGAWVHKLKKDGAYAVLDGEPILSEDAESYDTILEEVFGIKERFGIEIENKLVDFRKYTREILKGDNNNLHKWEETIEFFKNQRRPDEIMSLITPQIRQINRILKQEPA